LLEELQQQRAEVEHLRKDAERYRWLRDKSWRAPIAPFSVYRTLYDGSELDAAVDVGIRVEVQR
jgi:ribosomal protein L32E